MEALLFFMSSKITYQHRIFLFAGLSAMLLSFGKLEKGFEALRIFNYFKAKEIFEKQIEKEPAGAAYGLSIIYSRNDNPFYQLDSAFKYSTKAISAFRSTTEKEREKLAELQIDSLAIIHHHHRVDSLLYYRNVAASTDEALVADFIAQYPASAFVVQAANLRDSLAYAKALEVDSANAYRQFLNKYPTAAQADEALQRYEKTLFEEQTALKTEAAYQNFIKNYPASPYVKQAEYSIYSMSTKGDSVSDYLRFIRENPESPFVNNAWRMIYSLEVTSFTPREIAAFSLKYPDYPFEDELRESFRYATTAYYPIEVDEKWGFVDEYGTVMIEPEYEWNENFSEGLALVGKNGKAGYVDKSGALVVEAKFDDGYSFKNGFAVVEKNGLFGIIDRRGEYIAKPIYEDAGEASGGYFYVQLNGKYGYLNSAGKFVIPARYDDATDFMNGLAVVEQNGAKGMIDTIGKVVLDFNYQWIESYEKPDRPVRIKRHDKFGLADAGGNIIAEPVFDAMGEFSGGYILAAKDGRYGFLKPNGDTLLPFRYDFNQVALQQSYFSDGYAKYYRKQEVGIIDTTGKTIFPAIFKDIKKYEPNGLTAVIKHDKWGYAGPDVKLVIPYKFDNAMPFSDSTAVVQYKKKFGLIDLEGKFLIEPKYDDLLKLDSNLFLVRDSLYGIIKTDGTVVLPMIYTAGSMVSDAVLKLEQDDRMSYYDIRRKQFIWKAEE